MRAILPPNLCEIIKEDIRCKKSEKQQNNETNSIQVTGKQKFWKTCEKIK
jgi:hypothetical protein